MENFLNDEIVKSFLLYSSFGAVIALDVWWIGYAIKSAVCGIIKLFKSVRSKKQDKE